MAIRQPRPSARCTHCGTVSAYAAHINKRCVREFGNGDDKKRCEGAFKAAVDPGDWSECSACGATGMRGDYPCPQCRGDGWIFRRA